MNVREEVCWRQATREVAALEGGWIGSRYIAYIYEIFKEKFKRLC